MVIVMKRTNAQKGLQSVKHTIPEISVTGDSFPAFLDWLLNEKGYTSTGLIQVVEKPHHHTLEWEEYHEQND